MVVQVFIVLAQTKHTLAQPLFRVLFPRPPLAIPIAVRLHEATEIPIRIDGANIKMNINLA